MISKRKYLPFRLEDLTGGINVRDYASEIEDKQCVSLENWNFKGNKLVSEKGIEDSGNAVAPSPIGALTIDTQDVWTIASNILYKNGVELESKEGARIKVSGIEYTYTEEVKNDAGDVITNKEVGDEYFPEGVYYYVNIDGIDYGVQGTSELEVYKDLSEQLTSAGYTTNLTNDYLYITSDTEIVVTIPNYKTYVLYLSNVISGSNYRWINSWAKGYTYSINGVGPNIIWNDYTVNSGASSSEKFNLDKIMRDELYDSINSLGLNIDISKGYLKSGFLEDGTGLIWGAEDVSGYATVIVSRAENITTTEYIPSVGGRVGGNDVFIIKNFPSTDPTDYFTLNGGEPTEERFYFEDEGITSRSSWLQWFFDNGYPNTLQIYAKWTGDGNSPDDEVGIYPVDANNYSAGLISVSGMGSSEVAESNWYGLSEESFEINSNTFENNLVSADLPALGRANITIGNSGQLIMDKDDGGAYYFTEDVLYSPTEDEIGKPTVGTIYNGKAVLGGYTDNDNIIFSQTSTPTQPLNILNFSDYSAGGQSISGGDKGLITGMMVGENGLYVFKDNSVWYSNSEKDDGASLSFNLIFNKITSNGALTQNVITEVDQEIFYLDWKNRAVRRLGYEQNLTTLRDVAISREVSDLWEDLPDDQPMATAHFSYPNYQLSLSDGQGADIECNNGNAYKFNNKHFIYNVENKSWTTRTGIDNLIASDEGMIVLADGKTCIDFKGNTEEDGEYISKEYTFGDDIMYKKYGRFEIVGQIIPEATFEKTLTLEIWVDGEMIDERNWTKGATSQIREKIDLFDIGQTIQFKLKHSGKGAVEVYDAQIYYKGTNIQPQDFS